MDQSGSHESWCMSKNVAVDQHFLNKENPGFHHLIVSLDD